MLWGIGFDNIGPWKQP